MLSKTTQANIFLTMSAILWGLTFVFQHRAMEYVTPLAYGGLRFTLGGLALLPLAIPRALKLLRQIDASSSKDQKLEMVKMWGIGSLISGGFIFVGVTLQQYGLLWTTVGKAGFISSLYVVIVPLILRLMGYKITLGEAFGAVLAVIGLYFLSFTTGMLTIARGDALVLISTFVWAGHVLSLAWLSPRMDSIILGTGQALVTGITSLIFTAFLGQLPSLEALKGAWVDIAWGGFVAVAIGYTFQVVGQKHARPAPAAIILQLEAVVAVIAGWLWLNEIMTSRMIFGAIVMLCGMLLCQLWPIFTRKYNQKEEG